jgi:hypothetical protein
MVDCMVLRKVSVSAHGCRRIDVLIHCRRICVLHGRPGTVAIADIDAELPVENEAFDDHDFSRFPNISGLIYLTIRLGDISNAM